MLYVSVVHVDASRGTGVGCCLLQLRERVIADRSSREYGWIANGEWAWVAKQKSKARVPGIETVGGLVHCSFQL
jgi:hypothetical protein